MELLRFVPPDDAIQADAGITIAAPPEQVAAIYRNVENWGDTFPATIAAAHIIESGANWKQIEVQHKQEGRVPNTLIDLSENEIALQESKKKFDASFLNRFERTANDGTHYVVHAYIRPKGIYRLLRPFLAGYVRRRTLKQVKSYVLEPLKVAAEQQSSLQAQMKS